MIPAIQKQFTEQIRLEAIQRYGIPADQVRSVGGFESFVYEYRKKGKSYILKITHTLRRSIPYIFGEIEWLNHLADQGLSVSRVVPSTRGHMVEEIPAGQGSFLAISYAKAPGTPITAEVWDESLFEKWGELLGKIHHATKEYTLSSPAYKRQEWEDEEQLKADKYLQPGDVIIPLVKQRMQRLHALPRTKDTYGLVHADIHNRNFYLHEGIIHLFDFDDCSYTYFVNDIGIALYYALCFPPMEFENKAEYCTTMFRNFMMGYLGANTVTEDEIAYLQDFIKLRHTLNYIIFHQTNDVTRLNEEASRLLKQHQREIETEDPMIPVDFVQEFRDIQSRFAKI